MNSILVLLLHEHTSFLHFHQKRAKANDNASRAISAQIFHAVRGKCLGAFHRIEHTDRDLSSKNDAKVPSFYVIPPRKLQGIATSVTIPFSREVLSLYDDSKVAASCVLLRRLFAAGLDCGAQGIGGHGGAGYGVYGYVLSFKDSGDQDVFHSSNAHVGGL